MKNFPNEIRTDCIHIGIEYNVFPSLLGALAIEMSSNGKSNACVHYNNLYNLKATSGKYRKYKTYADSIKDFVNELLSSRTSSDGPFKYKAIEDALSSEEAMDMLVRHGFTEQYLGEYKDNYLNTLLDIYSQNKLHNWDNLLWSREVSYPKKESAPVEKEEIYRVRLDWNKRDTQIFASPSYQDALEEALKHEGYKIYTNDGVLFEDPWQEDTIQEESTNLKYPAPVIHAIKGATIRLKKSPLYRSPLDKQPTTFISGDFYFYDNIVTNGMAKITKEKNIISKDPRQILGYIKIE